MKVWLVRVPSDPYEPWDVNGVFSSLDKAIEYRKTLPDWEQVDIEEWEVDNSDTSSNHKDSISEGKTK